MMTKTMKNKTHVDINLETIKSMHLYSFSVLPLNSESSPGFPRNRRPTGLGVCWKYFIATVNIQRSDARTLAGTRVLSHEQML